MLISPALPLASCARYEDEQGRRVRVERSEPLPEGVREVVDRTWALEDSDAADPSSWMVLPAFTWPSLAVWVLIRRGGGRLALAVRVLEPPLSAGCVPSVPGWWPGLAA